MFSKNKHKKATPAPNRLYSKNAPVNSRKRQRDKRN